MNTSSTSFSFVITAIYTYTFANVIMRVLRFDEVYSSIALQDGINGYVVVSAAMCMIMTLRFFFGNNNYVDELYAKTTSAKSRLFHLATIVVQSLVLLASSFLIRNQADFFGWLSLLFLVELLWYLISFAFTRPSVSSESRRLNSSLLWNEIANLMMFAAALGGACLAPNHPFAATLLVAVVFSANTLIDARVNLDSYMGVKRAHNASFRTFTVRIRRPPYIVSSMKSSDRTRFGSAVTASGCRGRSPSRFFVRRR